MEETFELREAILSGNREGILEEAGDLLFLIFFLGKLTLKASMGFGIKEIADGVVDKMVRRHPHVFDTSEKLETADEVLSRWHKIKRAEKKGSGLFDSVPLSLPALSRNYRLSSKASKAGFDWDNPLEVRAKLNEELAELDAELDKGDYKENQQRLSEELGDVLAAVSNLARLLGISAEKALDAHNRRFIERLDKVSEALGKEGRVLEDASKEELEELWQVAKKS